MADHEKRLETASAAAPGSTSWGFRSQEEGDCCCSRRMGESQNTFSWTGWMTGWMDGKSFTTTTSFTICNKPLHRKFYCLFTKERKRTIWEGVGHLPPPPVLNFWESEEGRSPHTCQGKQHRPFTEKSGSMISHWTSHELPFSPKRLPTPFSLNANC